MSGRKQHYLPQFIQKNFSHRQSGKEFYVYVYHKTYGNFSPNTSGIGKELDFYSTPENTKLDELITGTESHLSIIVKSIANNEFVTSEDMAFVVCALSFRTKNMRNTIKGLTSTLLEGARIKSQSANWANCIRANLPDIIPLFRGKMREFIKARNRSDYTEQEEAALLNQIERYLCHKVETDVNFFNEILPLPDEIFGQIQSEAESISDESFLQALNDDPEMRKRALVMLERFSFEVIRAEGEDYFVLGDCGSFCVFSDNKPRILTADINNECIISSVYMPISPRHCILATRGKIPSEVYSPAEINLASASLSLEFFITHKPLTKKYQHLHEKIGTSCTMGGRENLLSFLLDELG